VPRPIGRYVWYNCAEVMGVGLRIRPESHCNSQCQHVYACMNGR
jgi:hypothetical protein